MSEIEDSVKLFKEALDKMQDVISKLPEAADIKSDLQSEISKLHLEIEGLKNKGKFAIPLEDWFQLKTYLQSRLEDVKLKYSIYHQEKQDEEIGKLKSNLRETLDLSRDSYATQLEGEIVRNSHVLRQNVQDMSDLQKYMEEINELNTEIRTQNVKAEQMEVARESAKVCANALLPATMEELKEELDVEAKKEKVENVQDRRMLMCERVWPRELKKRFDEGKMDDSQSLIWKNMHPQLLRVPSLYDDPNVMMSYQCAEQPQAQHIGKQSIDNALYGTPSCKKEQTIPETVFSSVVVQYVGNEICLFDAQGHKYEMTPKEVLTYLRTIDLDPEYKNPPSGTLTTKNYDVLINYLSSGRTSSSSEDPVQVVMVPTFHVFQHQEKSTLYDSDKICDIVDVSKLKNEDNYHAKLYHLAVQVFTKHRSATTEKVSEPTGCVYADNQCVSEYSLKMGMWDVSSKKPEYHPSQKATLSGDMRQLKELSEKIQKATMYPEEIHMVGQDAEFVQQRGTSSMFKIDSEQVFGYLRDLYHMDDPNVEAPKIRQIETVTSKPGERSRRDEKKPSLLHQLKESKKKKEESEQERQDELKYTLDIILNNLAQLQARTTSSVAPRTECVLEQQRKEEKRASPSSLLKTDGNLYSSLRSIVNATQCTSHTFSVTEDGQLTAPANVTLKSINSGLEICVDGTVISWYIYQDSPLHNQYILRPLSVIKKQKKNKNISFPPCYRLVRNIKHRGPTPQFRVTGYEIYYGQYRIRLNNWLDWMKNSTSNNKLPFVPKMCPLRYGEKYEVYEFQCTPMNNYALNRMSILDIFELRNDDDTHLVKKSSHLNPAQMQQIQELFPDPATDMFTTTTGPLLLSGGGGAMVSASRQQNLHSLQVYTASYCEKYLHHLIDQFSVSDAVDSENKRQVFIEGQPIGYTSCDQFTDIFPDLMLSVFGLKIQNKNTGDVASLGEDIRPEFKQEDRQVITSKVAFIPLQHTVSLDLGGSTIQFSDNSIQSGIRFECQQQHPYPHLQMTPISPKIRFTVAILTQHHGEEYQMANGCNILDQENDCLKHRLQSNRSIQLCSWKRDHCTPNPTLNWRFTPELLQHTQPHYVHKLTAYPQLLQLVISVPQEGIAMASETVWVNKVILPLLVCKSGQTINIAILNTQVAVQESLEWTIQQDSNGHNILTRLECPIFQKRPTLPALIRNIKMYPFCVKSSLSTDRSCLIEKHETDTLCDHNQNKCHHFILQELTCDAITSNNLVEITITAGNTEMSIYPQISSTNQSFLGKAAQYTGKILRTFSSTHEDNPSFIPNNMTTYIQNKYQCMICRHCQRAVRIFPKKKTEETYPEIDDWIGILEKPYGLQVSQNSKDTNYLQWVQTPAQ